MEKFENCPRCKGNFDNVGKKYQKICLGCNICIVSDQCILFWCGGNIVLKFHNAQIEKIISSSSGDFLEILKLPAEETEMINSYASFNKFWNMIFGEEE